LRLSNRPGRKPANTAEQIGNEFEPFFGPHQGGILTPAQRHSYFAAFDLVSDRRDDVARSPAFLD